MENFNSGANIDVRPQEEKDKDYTFAEVVASVSPVNWIEKKQSEFRSFKSRFQSISGSCVAQTMAKIMGIMVFIREQVFIELSATSVYFFRVNKPNEGMGGVDAFEITRKRGLTFESLLTSRSKSNEELDNTVPSELDKATAEAFRIANYITVPAGSFDEVASIIQTTGKGIMVWFWFKGDEWWGKEIPEAFRTDINIYSADRHSVSAVDFGLLDGVQVIKIEDSAREEDGKDGGRRGNETQDRYITRDFFTKRNFFIGYPMNFKFEAPVSNKPSYDGTTKSLQDCLRYDGVFPSNVDSTGVFGAITWKAVRDFQVKYGLHPTGVDSVGPATKAKLVELFP